MSYLCDVCGEEDRDAPTICDACDSKKEAHIRADEREQCAKLVETIQRGESEDLGGDYFAAAIRARGDK